MGEDEPDAGLDFLDLFDAMSAHYHEHRREIARWPWKYFAAQWGRLLITAAEREVAEAARDREQALDDLVAAHKARH